MARTYRILHRPLKHRKVMYWLMLPELLGTVAMLVLFALAQPDLYRTLFWQFGFDHGFNSNPNMILYAYANHRPPPTVPFVWSQMLTSFNVAISILSLFVLITKLIMIIMHVYYPIVATFTALSMTGLYAASAGGQAGPDYADSRYPSPVAWYIRMSCDITKSSGSTLYGYCQMAKATFAVTIIMLVLYVANLVFAGWAMIPNKALDEEDEEDNESAAGVSTKEQSQWEMYPPQTPRTPGATPFTPRTTAFNRLNNTTNARYT